MVVFQRARSSKGPSPQSCCAAWLQAAHWTPMSSRTALGVGRENRSRADLYQVMWLLQQGDLSAGRLCRLCLLENPVALFPLALQSPRPFFPGCGIVWVSCQCTSTRFQLLQLRVAWGVFMSYTRLGVLRSGAAGLKRRLSTLEKKPLAKPGPPLKPLKWY